MGLIRQAMIFAILGTMFLGIATVYAQVSTELPEFKSGGSVNIGVPIDFDVLYQRVNAIYDVMEHDSSHIVWKFTGTTGDWAFVFADGRIVVASPVTFELAAKDTLSKELNDAIDMLDAVGGGINNEVRSNALKYAVYYADEPAIYHRIYCGFKGNFDYTLVVPNCTVNNARFSVTDEKDPYKQVYSIDGKEVASCVNNYGSCQMSSAAEITDKIPVGVHTISARDIDSAHTLEIEVITSPTPPKKFMLYGPGYIPWINETAPSQTMDDMHALIAGTTKNS
jgi:hypothetical protein